MSWLLDRRTGLRFRRPSGTPFPFAPSPGVENTGLLSGVLADAYHVSGQTLRFWQGASVVFPSCRASIQERIYRLLENFWDHA